MKVLCRSLVAVGLVSGLSVLAPMGLAGADGTESLGPPSVALAEGSGIAVGGTGMFTQPTAFTVDVPADASVEQVLLYFEVGHHSSAGPVAEPASIKVNDAVVNGQLIGGPTPFYGDVETSTHRADITAMQAVKPGTSTISVDGLDPADVTDGAGVLVVYDEPGKAAQLRLNDGNDIAFANFAAPLDATVPQTFTFGAADVDRTAQLSLMVASVHDPVPDGIPNPSGVPGHRPHSLEYTVGGVTTTVDYPFADDGRREFDFRTLDVAIPAGATTLTVHPLSSWDDSGDLPASLVWLNAALAVPAPAAVAPEVTPPTAPPTTPPAVTVPVTEAPAAVESEAVEVEVAQAELPRTGRDTSAELVLGLALLTVGGALVIVGLRRRPSVR